MCFQTSLKDQLTTWSSKLFSFTDLIKIDRLCIWFHKRKKKTVFATVFSICGSLKQARFYIFTKLRHSSHCTLFQACVCIEMFECCSWSWILGFEESRMRSSSSFWQTHKRSMPLPPRLPRTQTQKTPAWDLNQRAALLVLTRPGACSAGVCVSNQGWEEAVTERMYQLRRLIGLCSTVAQTISPTTDCNLTAPDAIH